MLKYLSKIQFVKRVVFSLAFLFLAFILPWWLVIIFGLILLFYFNNFYEFILAGLILDGLYGGIVSIENFYFIFTLLITISTMAIINFKKKLLIK